MISCSDYDYIEIVCLYRYQVSIELINGEQIQGIALDTKRNQAKVECIELALEGSQQLLELDRIKRLVVNSPNPHFSQVTFTTK